ncbi:MAG: hypothetical protein NVSMB70_21020 [Chamaesiphon sp.]
MRSSVLGVLHKKLTKLQDKDYQPGFLPPGLRSDLQSLIESAKVLSDTDQSLSDVLTGLVELNSTSSNRHSEPDVLRSQIDALLQGLESRLEVPELESNTGDGHLERSQWVNFSKIGQRASA